ncbi:MAG: VWA domain-containing protein, partial [Myxococcales bacterium]|nr:VWA domain-containing protein [Myxococcales bacterium]
MGLLVLAASACTGDGDDSIYGDDASASANSLTLGNDVTGSASQTGDGDGDPSTGDGDPSTGDGDPTGAPKLDTIPDDTGVEDSGPDDCLENIDIVFVMDVSTTMGPFFDKLELEIGAVHDALQQYELPEEPHYGLVVFVDDFTLVNAGAPYTDINELRADFAYWNNFTSSNQQTKGGGYNSTWTENSLDAMFAGAAGFQWRPSADTLRVIVHTTDDTFWNGPITANGVDIIHNYPDTVDILQEKEIRLFAFADLLGGQSGTDDVSMGFFTDFQGQPPIPAQTGGGV